MRLFRLSGELQPAFFALTGDVHMEDVDIRCFNARARRAYVMVCIKQSDLYEREYNMVSGSVEAAISQVCPDFSAEMVARIAAELIEAGDVSDITPDGFFARPSQDVVALNTAKWVYFEAGRVDVGTFKISKSHYRRCRFCSCPNREPCVTCGDCGRPL